MVLNASTVIGNLIESTESKKIGTSSNQYQIEESFDEKPTDSCTALWRAVIMQALIDAGNNFKRPEYKSYKAHAISWLSGGSDDFLEVCSLADLEPDYVKKMAKEAISRSCKWRKDKPKKFKQLESTVRLETLNVKQVA